ncbi:dethiobiotin synthase [Phenylobacterium sp.]|uniref:dethiobiotin synthase n=1 Tax=Phenylobacterium sp. TaxID=1871053 RepID=UPI0035629020
MTRKKPSAPLGLSVDALKPVVSGFDLRDWAGSDPGRLLAALGQTPTLQALHALSPWRFTAALAPPTAARLEGRDLPIRPIVDFCRNRMAAAVADLLIVEGVGGVMSPLAEHATGLDLMTALNLPTILVGGAYLGAISHTLTALEVLRTRRLEVAAVVISGSADLESPDFVQTVGLVTDFAGDLPVIAAPRNDALLDLIPGLFQTLCL